MKIKSYINFEKKKIKSYINFEKKKIKSYINFDFLPNEIIQKIIYNLKNESSLLLKLRITNKRIKCNTDHLIEKHDLLTNKQKENYYCQMIKDGDISKYIDFYIRKYCFYYASDAYISCTRIYKDVIEKYNSKKQSEEYIDIIIKKFKNIASSAHSPSVITRNIRTNVDRKYFIQFEVNVIELIKREAHNQLKIINKILIRLKKKKFLISFYRILEEHNYNETLNELNAIHVVHITEMILHKWYNNINNLIFVDNLIKFNNYDINIVVNKIIIHNKYIHSFTNTAYEFKILFELIFILEHKINVNEVVHAKYFKDKYFPRTLLEIVLGIVCIYPGNINYQLYDIINYIISNAEFDPNTNNQLSKIKKLVNRTDIPESPLEWHVKYNNKTKLGIIKRKINEYN